MQNLVFRSKHSKKKKRTIMNSNPGEQSRKLDYLTPDSGTI